MATTGITVIRLIYEWNDDVHPTATSPMNAVGCGCSQSPSSLRAKPLKWSQWLSSTVTISTVQGRCGNCDSFRSGLNEYFAAAFWGRKIAYSRLRHDFAKKPK